MIDLENGVFLEQVEDLSVRKRWPDVRDMLTLLEPADIAAVLAELPEGCGEVETMLWDFEGSDEFTPGGKITGTDGGRVRIENSHTFTRTGTHFPVVKVAVNRKPGDEFTRIYNQARVRVIVEE